MLSLKKYLKENIYYIAWVQVLVATLGSLYFSEVLKYTPCVLCWYQRIFMYPQVFIIAVGIYRKDKNLPYYVLPLTIVGWVIAFYHNLLYYHIVSENLTPCSLNVPCTTRFFAWFGIITIPLLSLTAFTVVNICMFLAKRYNRGAKALPKRKNKK
ncbi:MAG TPA: disulfide oxidoreductase [Patescibacteria group bacterium]